MKLGPRLDTIGVPGSIVTALCCLGVSAVVSVATALGLGFLLRDEVLLPVLFGFLALTGVGLFEGWRRHRHAEPLFLGALSALALVIAVLVAPAKAIAYASIAGLIAASILNLAFGHVPRRRRRAGV